MDPEQYCREIEAYLCRKNDGHLIRVVGPAFERVCGWAQQGIPVKVAFRGIDRYFERYYAKGPRRRPVRIDFCEADVLDVFDEWRRAVGLSGRGAGAAAGGAGPDDTAPAGARATSLPAHLDRVVARLTGLRARPDLPPAIHALIDRLVRELDTRRAEARAARGDARTALLDRLSALDRELVDAAAATLPDDLRAQLEREAGEDLAAFRPRMTDPVFRQALDAGVRRLVRQRLGLPDLSLR